MTKAAASHRRILFASLVGTSVEFYDFYIYATAAAIVFPDLFFPASEPWIRQLASYASFSVAFFARPLGGLVFGHFGDRMGRKSTLVASLMLMGISTVLIGFLPGYAMLGWMAPLLLCLLRFGQGLGLGGEWGGASLLAVENAPPGWANRYGSFPPMGAPVGFIFANGFFLILGAVMDDAQFREWGWRLPFLASAVLVFLGLWVRLKITETPEFVAATEKEAPPAVPIGELFRTSALATFAGTVGTVACFALFYISTVFIIGHGTKTLGYDRETFLAVELLAILFMAAGIVTAGISADKRTANAVLMFGCIFTIPVGMAMALLVVPGSLASVAAWLAFALFVMGFVYGPLGGWLPSLFPARVRYTGVSVTFNLGGILGGGLTPLIAETLVKQGGLTWVGYYLAGAGLLSLIGLILVRDK
ncbi:MULTISPECIES: MFS transporter [unclassified Sphingomonas]|uniref:MFS transporter n=1 Tax=Sphingomonas TaxID=13687 RepID=UPI00096664E0|nr:MULTISPECIES: MFS transporter [unclassified Sphingomonas]MBN8813188.1 MFS transporter [Sphingomonas sp.]OJY53484.1 MAG: MFS transporter [Sphingomonas sp. 67-41]